MKTDKLDLATPDLVNQNIEKIAALFPNCVTETAEGKAIDFDLLKQELNHEVVEGAKERYRLEWPGKKEAIVTANLPTTKTLRPVREDSVNFDTTENMYIEGDNLEVLKILQESYLGKIKMIYIDPPYNTGKDFVYKDNFTQDSADYKEETDQTDEYGNRLVANPETAGRYHSDWLSMMYPRLKLARNLLTDDGVIFMSIGEDESHNLRKLADEIFGESNFETELTWQKRYTRSNNTIEFTTVVETILIYSKSESFVVNLLPRTAEADNRYKNPDNDDRGPWKGASFLGPVKPSERPNLCYGIKNPYTGTETFPTSNAWRRSEEEFKKLQEQGVLYWGKDKSAKVPSIKMFLKEARGLTPTNFWSHDYAGNTDTGTRDVEELFNLKVFDFPKPVLLMKRILEHSVNDNDIVLDFFSGSASLAHGVFSFNSEMKKNIQFILIQIPEFVNSQSEVFKAGYNNICEIGKERIRRAAAKIKEETNADIDYGFKVFKVASSNMQDVYYKPQDYSQGQLDVFADNIKEDRTSEDLLTQILLDWGLPLTLKTETLTIQGKEVFKVDTNYLMACFANGVDEAFAKEIATHQPLRIVFKDSGFKNDTAKENVKQLLKQLSPNTEMKVI
ncbi:site-specific DNA-methyltransferase [Winogradskyella sediminis]|uniref:site-specific DNA-methyltransferase n=1 Tax=Winogradskyella sediminis TaxID=1382466 RepID=UPI003AA84DC1